MPDDLLRILNEIGGIVSCAHCGAPMVRIPEDDTDPVVKALGRLCQACVQRQEEVR